MMRVKSHGAGLLIAVGLWCLPRAEAVSPVRLSGAIAGQVTDSAGVPQMGATVLLFNRFDKLAQKVITDQQGSFVFAGLLPDLYSVRVTLAAFVPAVRDHIVVQPGMRSVLNVSLANLFSSIQLLTPHGEQRSLMSEDWKWVLRGSSETRPILRYIPRAPEPRQHAALFSDTRGVLRLSAGEGDASSSWGQSDLGTAFALATSVYGNNLLQFSGRVGYSSGGGIPSAAFRTTFSRHLRGGSPEVSVTMRQLMLPGRFGAAVAGEAGALPALRSSSLNFEDRTQLSEAAWLHYGFSLDSISFLQRLNYFSPFARLSYALGEAGSLDFTYTSGNPRPELGAPQSSDFQRDLNTLGLFPRVSLRGGRAHVQRGENIEAAYSRRFGSRGVQVSGYRESVNNAALTLADPENAFAAPGDILPDLYSSSSVFNAGRYETMGFTVSVTQDFGSNFSATMIYGSIGALGLEPGQVESENPDQLRAMIRAGRRNAATLRTNATVPASGTHVVASYQWTDQRMVSPGRIYSTGSERPEPGLNLYLRQPVPGWSLLPWRMEITADLRNLLAQGYVPLSMTGGRRAFLMQTPRSFRGGLSFIF